MILKAIIKFFLKLLFLGGAAYRMSAEELNGKSSDVKDRLNQAERDGDQAFETVRRRMTQMEDEIEAQLNRRVEGFQRKLMSVCGENNSDINELRAELAELRAELRELKSQRAAKEENGATD